MCDVYGTGKMTKQACSNCRWYGKGNTKGNGAVFFSRGVCKVSAPVMSNGNSGLGRGVFPSMEEDDWCGAWERRCEDGQ